MGYQRNIQWAAGLFEGEGWCGIYLHPRPGGRLYQYVQLGLGTTDRDVLDEFARIIGSGNIHGPYPNKHGGKAIYVWRAKNSDSKAILRRLRPYLLGRRAAKVDEALNAPTGRMNA